MSSGIAGTNGAAGEDFPGKSGGFKSCNSSQGGAAKLFWGILIFFPLKNKFVIFFFFDLCFADSQLLHF